MIPPELLPIKATHPKVDVFSPQSIIHIRMNLSILHFHELIFLQLE